MKKIIRIFELHIRYYKTKNLKLDYEIHHNLMALWYMNEINLYVFKMQIFMIYSCSVYANIKRKDKYTPIN